MQNASRAQQRLCDRGFDIAVDGDFGPISHAALISFVGRKRSISRLRLALGGAMAREFPKVGLERPLRLAHALGQQSAETGGFGSLVESLNYSVAGLRATFSRSRISNADVQRLGRKPGERALSTDRQRQIANIVYGGSFGRDNLGNTQEGVGWRYRGRGVKQLTGRYNYTTHADTLKLPIVEHPELLEDPLQGVRAACHFWDSRGCNALADRDDLIGLTRRINGGTNGLAQRRDAMERAKAILVS
ncbi:MAG: endolysin [Erythrobacteraceae bacterium]|nr:endolysin [Erythrobacteraceae bacterium]|tara:strand:- start:152 stop:889 length:738 start_codon:yes stop_codon:yes gene_type:complete